ncbi:MAG: hypothetical protein JWM87_1297 [Candidatus Eremiobacteraeota bacterium]|nr:hypothetical protein [Candidatus Eremiobacteraeota bacterium]
MQHTDAGTAVVATYTDRNGADKAIQALHDEGFKRTWLAVIDRSAAGPDTFQQGDATAQRRWFRKDAKQTLYDALRDRGVSDDVALQLDDSCDDGDVILVTESANDPAYAQEIVQREGGKLLSAPTPLKADAPADRSALRERRQAIAPVVREDVFVCREPRAVRTV